MSSLVEGVRVLRAGELAATVDLPASESRALLAHVLGLPRERLLAHPDLPVAPEDAARWQRLARDRASGTPMAYLLGEREFLGHRFAVGPGVLVPRPETEILVEAALDALRDLPGARVLDLGTGSGCIAISLALARPDLQILAVDRSQAALGYAQGNALRLGARIALRRSDWYGACAGMRFHLVAANPPYVAGDDPHLAGLACEPREALTDGGDGLGALRRVLAGASQHLLPGGAVLVEHGFDQGEAVRALACAYGLGAVRSLRDLAGIERVCAAQAASI